MEGHSATEWAGQGTGQSGTRFRRNPPPTSQVTGVTGQPALAGFPASLIFLTWEGDMRLRRGVAESLIVYVNDGLCSTRPQSLQFFAEVPYTVPRYLVPAHHVAPVVSATTPLDRPFWCWPKFDNSFRTVAVKTRHGGNLQEHAEPK